MLSWTGGGWLGCRVSDALDDNSCVLAGIDCMTNQPEETVPACEDAWIECLGDFAHYRMAFGGEDLRDCGVWSGVAGCWYNKAADERPKVGGEGCKNGIGP